MGPGTSGEVSAWRGMVTRRGERTAGDGDRAAEALGFRVRRGRRNGTRFPEAPGRGGQGLAGLSSPRPGRRWAGSRAAGRGPQLGLLSPSLSRREPPRRQASPAPGSEPPVPPRGAGNQGRGSRFHTPTPWEGGRVGHTRQIPDL